MTTRLKLSAAVMTAIMLIGLSTAAVAAHEHRDAGDISYVVGWLDEPAYEGIPNAVSVRVSGPIDIAVGALFEGGGLNPGESFTYTFGAELVDSTVAYHNHIHPELGGTVMVTEKVPEGDVEIEISAAGYSPADVMVHPGSSVTWRNVTETVQAVHSGDGMAMDMEGDDHEAAAPSGPIEGLDGALKVEVTHVPTGATRTLALEAAFRDPGHYVAPVIPTAPGAYTFRFTGEIDGSPIDETFESGPETFDDIQTQASVQFPLEVSAPREVEGAARGAMDAAVLAEDTAAKASDDASSAETLAIVAIIVGVGGAAAGVGGLAVGLRRK